MQKKSKSQRTNAAFFVLALVFIVFVLLIFNVKATDSIDEIDTYFETARGQLLQFYGSEIVSHAAIILGLVVALLSIVRVAWKWLYPRTIKRFIALFVLVFVLMLVPYSVGRLLTFTILVSSKQCTHGRN